MGSSSRCTMTHFNHHIVSNIYRRRSIQTLQKTYGLDAEICRFYNVYGPDEIIEGDWAAVIGIWRRQVRDGEKITIIGDGEQRRDFTHVVDIVDALYKIGMGDKKHEDAWELGTGTNYSINEVFGMFLEKYPQIESVYLPDQP